MLRRYRLFLVILGVAALAGLAVALAPLQQLGAWNDCMGLVGIYRHYCGPGPSPDVVAGIWAAIIVYGLLTGLVLSARALASK